MQYFIYTLLLLLVSPIAIAGPFDPSATDKSVEMLGLFGNIGTVTSGAANPALQAIFDRFNWAVVTVSIIILGYTTIVSLVNTAQEGQVMGKKWSSAWIPLKSLLGILLMVPIATSGYSVIQAMIMWIIIQGVGLADTIWGVILDNLGKGISASRTMKINSVQEYKLQTLAENIFADMLASSMCHQTAIAIGRGKSNNSSVDNRDPNVNSILTLDFGQKIRLYNNNPTPNNGTVNGTLNLGVKNHTKYSNVCGSWKITAHIKNTDVLAPATVPAKNTAARILFATKTFAINSMKEITDGIARDLIDKEDTMDVIFKDKYGAKREAMLRFIRIMSGQVIPTPSKDALIIDAVKYGKQLGWSVAGSYYFVLQRTTEQNLIESAFDSSDITTTPLKQTTDKYFSDAEQKVLESMLAQGNIYNSMSSFNDKVTFSNDFKMPKISEEKHWAIKLITDSITELMKIVFRLFTDIISTYGVESETGDPLVAMANVGKAIMFAAEATWLAVIVGSVGAAAFITLLTLPPAVAWLLSGGIVLLGIFMMALIMVYSLGVSLAIYLPYIPYLIYTAGVLGWLMLVIEAIVAGPIIALGIIVPSQGEIGRVAPSLSILGGIFLRPTLMIFGFILAAKLLQTIINFINFGFFQTMILMTKSTADVGGDITSPPGIFSGLFVVILYVVFVLAITNKVFALIYALPDKILTYIGGTAGTVGQEMAGVTSEAKQGFDKAKETAKGQMTDISTKGISSMSGAVDQAKKKSEDNMGGGQ